MELDNQMVCQLQSEDMNVWWESNVSGVATGDMHPIEITTCLGYHETTGLIFVNTPLFCISMGCGLAKI